MEKLFYTVLKMSVTGSWVILAVLLLRLLLRKAPKKYSYALWIAAAFRLLCPVSFQSALSLFNLRLGTTASPVVDLPAVTAAEYNFVRPQITTGVPAMNAVVSGSFTAPEPTVVNSANPEQIFLFIGMVLWCAGVAAMAIYAVASWLRLRMRMRDAVILKDGVWQTDKVASPFLLGLFRPRIYVPYGLQEQEMEHILAHERMHLRRLDHVVKPLAFLILTIHWFNPLVWLAFFLMCRDMELSCDEAVLRRRGDIRREYSQTLLNVAAARRFPSPSPLAFGEGDVKCRIRSALKWKKPRVWVTIVALLLCAAAVVACTADPREEPENEYFPFADVYRAEEVIYQCPMFSMLYRPEGLPEVALSSDQGMFLREPYGAAEQTYAGVLLPVKLKTEEFEALFLNPLQEIGEKLRKSNKNVWHLDGEEQWYLLEQKNGDLYLARCFAFGSHDATARWVARLTPANQIWASTDGHSHYDLARYFPEQEIDYAALPVVSAGEMTTLEFHLNWDCPSLTVVEDYYEHNDTGVELHKSETTLTPGDDGVFRLPAARRNGNSQDYALYYVQDGDTRHVLRVNFSGTASRPALDHETPDPNTTAQLQSAWSEARLRSAFLESERYQNFEILDLVVMPDGSEDLAGVVQYRENGQEGCLAFVPKNGAIHPVTLPDMADVPENAMACAGAAAVQLQLKSTVHDTVYLYTVSFSLTAEGVHIVAESDVIWTPVDHAVQSVLKEVLRQSDQPTGLVQARSYAIVNSLDQADGSTRVCAWLMYRDYSVSGGLTPVNTRYGPAVLVFDKNWELADVQMLTDSHTPGDVKSFFGHMAALVLEDAQYDAETYRLPLTQACYDQAVAYVGLEPDKLAAEAFAAVLSGAKPGSDAKTLLSDHTGEYETLLQLGDYTLQYIFSRFLAGGVTEPEGKVLQSVMDALLGGEAIKTHTETGQAYFDAWREHTQRLQALNGDSFVRENLPKSWLLLQMLQGTSEAPEVIETIDWPYVVAPIYRAYVDLDGDGREEMLLKNEDGSGFGIFTLYAQDAGGEYQPVFGEKEARQCFGDLRYSPANRALVYTEYRPSGGVVSYGFWQLRDGDLVHVFSIGRDEDASGKLYDFRWENGEKTVLTEAQREAVMAELQNLEFTIIASAV